jgi:ADP-ribose pyrophosphatase YjhB (NUDIX family)
VIIGRFQTNKLHEGHLELFKKASEVSDFILVCVGISASVGTDKNPINYVSIKKMIKSVDVGSKIVVLPLYDNISDLEWSIKLDECIDVMKPSSIGHFDVIIWGGRDNSIEGYYKGRYKIQTINGIGDFSATKIRHEIGKNPIDSEDFRSGIIYASQNRYPIVYSTVDVVVKKDGKYLVGKKGDKYCFVGGFVDCADKNIEQSAIRELEEETGITQFDSISYLGSIKIDDPRYRGTKDSIMTHCFLVKNPKDLENKIKDKEFSSFAWFTLDELEFNLHEHHKPLLTFLK